MNKIALYIHGFANVLNKELIQYIQTSPWSEKKDEIDIFISLWINKEEERDMVWKECKILKPKYMELEVYPDYLPQINNVQDGILCKNKNKQRYRKDKVIPFYYKLWKCNELKNQYLEYKNDDKNDGNIYDFVISIDTSIPYELYTNIRLGNVLSFDNHILYLKHIDSLYQYSFIYGSEKSMNKLSSIFLRLTEFCNETQCYFDPFDILETFVEYCNITVNRIV